jgi:ABC-type multidrug transport system fused ATPase/permease subunit
VCQVRLIARLQRILFFSIMRQDITYFDGAYVPHPRPTPTPISITRRSTASSEEAQPPPYHNVNRPHQPPHTRTRQPTPSVQQPSPATGTGSLTSRLTSDATLLGSILTTNCNVAVQSLINLLGSVAYLFVLVRAACVRVCLVT